MAERVVKMTGWARRKVRVRKKISGSTERPRLNIYRSNRHIYAQIIDDRASKTLLAVSTMNKEIASAVSKLKKAAVAKKVGETIGKLAVAKGIKKVVFDRAGYLYHGRVKAVADGAREAGLNF